MNEDHKFCNNCGHHRHFLSFHADKFWRIYSERHFRLLEEKTECWECRFGEEKPENLFRLPRSEKAENMLYAPMMKYQSIPLVKSL